MTKTPIKAKYNHTKGNWQVVRQTAKGAWEVINNQTCESLKTANLMVNWYLEAYPDKYQKANEQ